MLKPFKFTRNRVLRLYRGGSGIDRLRGEPGEDTRFPEDWIASCIEGNGRAYHSPGHGVSKIEYGGELHSFPEFLAEHAAGILGERHIARFGVNPAVLTKLLDSAERLPLQVHPARADAERLFCLPYGKTEAWIVLATRMAGGEEPYLLAGFNGTFDRETFFRESREGVYRKGLGMLHKLAVKPGDVIVIRGGLPHAIGPGVTMVEVMEPSDLVIVPEIDCCGVMLDEAKRFAGLAPETALALFDTAVRSEAELRAAIMPRPETVEWNGAGILRTILPYSACSGYFQAQELTLDGEWPLPPCGCFRIGIPVEGEFRLGGLTLRAGESFMVPYEAEPCPLSGRGRVIWILPPR